jgi:hypothetical protein
MVSEPVTFGGGIEMTKTSAEPGRGWKTPRSSQNEYQWDSTWTGSYG